MKRSNLIKQSRRLKLAELSISSGNKTLSNYFNIKLDLEILACSNPSPCYDKVLLSVDKHFTILTQMIGLQYFYV